MSSIVVSILSLSATIFSGYFIYEGARYLWRKNLEDKEVKLNELIDTLIDSVDYKTSSEKQQVVQELTAILCDYKSKIKIYEYNKWKKC